MSVIKYNPLSLDWDKAGSVVRADFYVLKDTTSVSRILQSLGEGPGHGLIVSHASFNNKPLHTVSTEVGGMPVYGVPKTDATAIRAFIVPSDALMIGAGMECSVVAKSLLIQDQNTPDGYRVESSGLYIPTKDNFISIPSV